MSPKFYSLLWMIFAVTAGILWLGGVFTMFAGVVLGFVAFGLVFVGMMCVLPGAVSHPSAMQVKQSAPKTTFKKATTQPARSGGGFTTYRSA